MELVLERDTASILREYLDPAACSARFRSRSYC